MASFLAAFAAHFLWYNLFAALGLCAALAAARARLAESGLPEGRQTALLLCALPCFLIGAAVSNLANWFFFPELLALPLGRRILSAGFTFYPGMIAAIGLYALLLRLLRLPVAEMMDRLVPAFPLFHAIARVGCCVAGCCYGIPVGRFRFPSQALEVAACFCIFLWLWRGKSRRPCRFYFTVYPLYRFFAEFLRGDSRGVLLPGCPLSVSQQISLCILAGLALFTLISRKKRKES